ncbi:MAG: cadmium-translocating P-type ATPase, partial [Deltaproteobacteria bacterium]
MSEEVRTDTALICCSSCTVPEDSPRTDTWKRGALLSLAGFLILLGGLAVEYASSFRSFSLIFYLLSALIGGSRVLKSGLLLLIRERRFGIDSLVTVAAVGSFLIGHGEEGAAVLVLFSLAESLETYAEERARSSIRALLQLTPETARLVTEGGVREVHVHDVKVGDLVGVRPGERIPLDGRVEKGVSTVDESPITGESIPVRKAEGDYVYGGSINGEGYLEVRVERTSSDSLISRIVSLIEKAREKKSRTEAFIDRFSRYYTPAVLALALVSLSVPFFVPGLSFRAWVYRSLVLLVVSCPCALAISTPVSLVSALTSAARRGVVIKGGKYVEELGKARVIVFDKTGTLTEGDVRVEDLIPLNSGGDEHLLQIAASLESLSGHPLAEAVTKEAESRGISPLPASSFKVVPGRGVEGEVDGEKCLVGNREFFKEKGISLPEEDGDRLEGEGKTVIYVAAGEEVVGIISLADRIREEAPSVVRELKEEGIVPVMLTGDNRRVAGAVAEKLGIEEFMAEILPEEKVQAVERLKEKYGRVLMVG